MRAAELAQEVGVTQAAHGLVNRASGRPAEKRADGSGDSGDGMHTTGNFRNVNARITYLYWHYLILRSIAQARGRETN